MEGFDSKDMRILYELERDARQPVSGMAKKVRLSKQAVLYRIARLERLGVIERYITAINIAKLGYQDYEVWVRLDRVGGEEEKKFIAFLAQHQNVYWLASCTLSFDLSVGFMARNPAHLQQLWKDVLAKFGHLVNSYVISVVVDLFHFSRAYLLGKGGEQAVEYSFGGEVPAKPLELEENEKKLLGALALNAKARTVDLARKLKLSEKTVRKKIDGMRKSGLITGFKAHVHPSRLGYSWFEIFVNVHSRGGEQKKLLEFCRSHPNITYYIRCISKWDLDIAVEVKSLAEFQQIVAELRDKFSDIISSYETVGITFDHRFNYLPPLA